MRFTNLLVLLLIVGLTYGATSKTKKKHTTRSDLASTAEGAEAVAAESPTNNKTVSEGVVVDKKEQTEVVAGDSGTVKDSEAGANNNNNKTQETSSNDKEPEKGVESESAPEEGTPAVVPSKSYLTRVKDLLRRVLDLLGLSRQKRKGRKMKHDESMDNLQYVEDVRATVGAFLGRSDCMRKAACGAGRYLRAVKGKELLIVILEKMVPPSWGESLNHIKEAAIYKDTCDYSCLDD